MKKIGIALGFASLFAFGCARIPVVGNLYTEIYGLPGINSYQYLENNKRNFSFNFNQFEYYYSGNKDHIDLSQLGIKLERAIPRTTGRGYDHLYETKIFPDFDVGIGYYDNKSCVEARTSIDEIWIREKGFNFYYFCIKDKVIVSGEIK